MNDWKQGLIQKAEAYNMCSPYMNALKKVSDKKAALRLYKAGLDGALEHNYPDIDFIRNTFSKSELESFGIYVDRKFNGEIINNHIFQVFHNCSGSIKIELNLEKIIIPTLYLANNTELFVDIDKSIDISVYLFDNSIINAHGKWKKREVVKEASSDPNYKPNIQMPDL